MQTICLAAILRDEEPFLDEWLVYHKMIGIDHFYLYDDDPDLPLKNFLQPHLDYITVIPWHYMHEKRPGKSRQTKAYMHAVEEYGSGFEWITFIDGDEFIVLRNHETIKDFLTGFSGATSIQLNWHVYGHNGYYEDPPGLITASLIRRKDAPGYIKSITRPEAILDIRSAHYCQLKAAPVVDANKREVKQDFYVPPFYEGLLDVAHVNHYQSRSFKSWMRRVMRGDVTYDITTAPDTEAWRLYNEECLKQFVSTVALDKNEVVDTYMQKYTAQILYRLMKMGIKNKRSE